MIAIHRADQLHGNSQPIAVLPHASVQDRRDVEGVTDVPDIASLPP